MDDDYTFQEAGSPHVAGATVQLLDPYDNSQVIATGTTDTTGLITFGAVPEGPYLLRVTADGHDNYQSSIQVHAGVVNQNEVFIARNFVTYNWVVTPVAYRHVYHYLADDVPDQRAGSSRDHLGT